MKNGAISKKKSRPKRDFMSTSYFSHTLGRSNSRYPEHIWILFPAGFLHAWGFMMVFIGGANLLYNFTPAAYRATTLGLQWSFWSVAYALNLVVVEILQRSGLPSSRTIGYDSAAAVTWLICATTCGLGAVVFWWTAKRWAKM